MHEQVGVTVSHAEASAACRQQRREAEGVEHGPACLGQSGHPTAALPGTLLPLSMALHAMNNSEACNPLKC